MKVQWYVLWDIGGNRQDRRRDWYTGVHTNSETPRVEVSLGELHIQLIAELPVRCLDGYSSSLPSLVL